MAEIWHEAQPWLEGDQFDATMNYLFTMNLLGYLCRDNLDLDLAHEVWGYARLGTIELAAFAAEVDRILALYPRQANQAQLNLLDSHDTPRFLTAAKGDESAFRLATVLKMTYIGPPCIYYGDEIGLEGRHDPDCRRAFPWDKRRWNTSLRAFVKRCIELRKAHAALRRGSFERLHAADDVYAFVRKLEEESLVVILNASRQSRSPEIDVHSHFPEGAALVNVWCSERIVVSSGRLRGFTMAPRIAYVLCLDHAPPTGVAA